MIDKLYVQAFIECTLIGKGELYPSSYVIEERAKNDEKERWFVIKLGHCVALNIQALCAFKNVFCIAQPEYDVEMNIRDGLIDIFIKYIQ